MDCSERTAALLPSQTMASSVQAVADALCSDDIAASMTAKRELRELVGPSTSWRPLAEGVPNGPLDLLRLAIADSRETLRRFAVDVLKEAQSDERAILTQPGWWECVESLAADESLSVSSRACALIAHLAAVTGAPSVKSWLAACSLDYVSRTADEAIDAGLATEGVVMSLLPRLVGASRQGDDMLLAVTLVRPIVVLSAWGAELNVPLDLGGYPEYLAAVVHWPSTDALMRPTALQALVEIWSRPQCTNVAPFTEAAKAVIASLRVADAERADVSSTLMSFACLGRHVLHGPLAGTYADNVPTACGIAIDFLRRQDNSARQIGLDFVSAAAAHPGVRQTIMKPAFFSTHVWPLHSHPVCGGPVFQVTTRLLECCLADQADPPDVEFAQSVLPAVLVASRNPTSKRLPEVAQMRATLRSRALVLAPWFAPGGRLAALGRLEDYTAS